MWETKRGKKNLKSVSVSTEEECVLCEECTQFWISVLIDKNVTLNLRNLNRRKGLQERDCNVNGKCKTHIE